MTHTHNLSEANIFIETKKTYDKETREIHTLLSVSFYAFHFSLTYKKCLETSFVRDELLFISLTDGLLILLTVTLIVNRSMIIVVVIVLSRLNSFVDFCEDIHFVCYVFVQRILTFPLFW